LHQVFSAPEVIAWSQEGCKTATIRCEICKIEAGRSVCAVTEPIHSKRRHLEAEIDSTWEMLREQSAKAAERAEQTMVQVRSVLDLSHDLGSVRRYFGNSREDRRDPRDLSESSSWWNLPSDQRSKLLRDYWRSNLVPRDAHLAQESNRVFSTLDRELEEPFLTPKKKRAFVTTSRDIYSPQRWNFEIPNRSYEVWVFLGWRDQDKKLLDFVIPQKIFSQDFAQAKKTLKKDEKVLASVFKDDGDRFHLSIAGNAPRPVTELLGNYEPLI
jgi:tryptophanyl-tRNA synthetase